MPRLEGLNEKVGEIVNAVLGELSLEQAAIRLNYKVGREGLRLLRKGKVGREATVRAFAEGFSERICELYGAEIQQGFGECTSSTAADWLAGLAGFEPVALEQPWPGASAADLSALSTVMETLHRIERKFDQFAPPRQHATRNDVDELEWTRHPVYPHHQEELSGLELFLSLLHESLDQLKREGVDAVIRVPANTDDLSDEEIGGLIRTMVEQSREAAAKSSDE